MTILARERESGRYLAVTVTGARGPEAAMNAVNSASVDALSIEDSRQAAIEKANQLNAANGIGPEGCSTCG